MRKEQLEQIPIPETIVLAGKKAAGYAEIRYRANRFGGLTEEVQAEYSERMLVCANEIAKHLMQAVASRNDKVYTGYDPFSQKDHYFTRVTPLEFALWPEIAEALRDPSRVSISQAVVAYNAVLNRAKSLEGGAFSLSDKEVLRVEYAVAAYNHAAFYIRGSLNSRFEHSTYSLSNIPVSGIRLP